MRSDRTQTYALGSLTDGITMDEAAAPRAPWCQEKGGDFERQGAETEECAGTNLEVGKGAAGGGAAVCIAKAGKVLHAQLQSSVARGWSRVSGAGGLNLRTLSLHQTSPARKATTVPGLSRTLPSCDATSSHDRAAPTRAEDVSKSLGGMERGEPKDWMKFSGCPPRHDASPAAAPLPSTHPAWDDQASTGTLAAAAAALAQTASAQARATTASTRAMVGGGRKHTDGGCAADSGAILKHTPTHGDQAHAQGRLKGRTRRRGG